VLLARRGVCTFTDKARRGQEAGAAAVVVGNSAESVPHSLFVMHGNKPKPLHIPVAMVSHASYEALVRLLEGVGAPVLLTLREMGPADAPRLPAHAVGGALRAAVVFDQRVRP
jgi:hypothetical protein